MNPAGNKYRDHSKDHSEKKWLQSYVYTEDPSCKPGQDADGSPHKGKKHIIYFMFSFFQSTMGIGIFENMAKAALKLFHKLFMLPFLLYAIQGSRIRLPQPLLPALPASG